MRTENSFLTRLSPVQALFKWLRGQAKEGNDDAGNVLVLYFLQRQRLTEALQAFDQVGPVSGETWPRRSMLIIAEISKNLAQMV